MFLNFTKFSLQTIKGESPKIKNFYDQGLDLIEIKYNLIRKKNLNENICLY